MNERINIYFNVDGQHIRRVDRTLITSGSKNYFYAVFDLDEAI